MTRDSGSFSVHIHPAYTAFSANYDIAIIRLKQPLLFGIHVRPVCLPDRPSPDVDNRKDSLVTLTGKHPTGHLSLFLRRRKQW